MTNYNDDFFAWTQETARAIEAGRFEEIDRAALADEVESLGLKYWNQLLSRLTAILLHMLKLREQPGKKTRSWDLTIREQQIRVGILLKRNLSMRPHLPELMVDAYKLARLGASKETGLLLKAFPAKCPWSLEDVLGNDET